MPARASQPVFTGAYTLNLDQRGDARYTTNYTCTVNSQPLVTGGGTTVTIAIADTQTVVCIFTSRDFYVPSSTPRAVAQCAAVTAVSKPGARVNNVPGAPYASQSRHAARRECYLILYVNYTIDVPFSVTSSPAHPLIHIWRL
jgi:hypothetical protein